MRRILSMSLVRDRISLLALEGEIRSCRAQLHVVERSLVRQRVA